MAQRRMFAIKIIDSAKFLKMPVSSRLLYYDLGMRADDDGVVEAFNVIRMTGATEDDLKVLASKGYIRVLNEDLVTLITDWTEHNKIRADRKIDSLYKDLILQVVPDIELLEPKERADRKVLNNGTSHGQPMDSIGKDRLGKDRLEIEDSSSSLRSEELVAPEAAATPQQEEIERISYAKVQKLYNDLCLKMAKCTVMSEARKKAIKARFGSGYKLEDFERLFTLAAQSSFLNGGNKRNFMANFDWLIRDANMAKVLDGNYADRPNGNNAPDGGGFTYDYGDMSGSL